MTNWDWNNRDEAKRESKLQGLMDTFLKAQAQQESSGKPLKAVRISHASLLLFPAVATQEISAIDRFCGVVIEFDDTLSEGEWRPVYA